MLGNLQGNNARRCTYKYINHCWAAPIYQHWSYVDTSKRDKKKAWTTSSYQHHKSRDRHNTYTIHYRVLGAPDGQPLLFVHGTPWSSRVWVPYAQAYASAFRVYLFDNPGYGGSPGGIPISDSKGEPNVSLACQAEAFASLVRAWSLSEPPHVIAHDFGGIIPLRAHLCHGIQYASLCFVDPLAVSPFGSPVFRLVASNAEIFNNLPSYLSEAMVRSYIREAALKPLGQAIEDMLVKPWSASGLHGMAGFIRQVKQADQRDIEEVEQRFHEVGQKMPVKSSGVRKMLDSGGKSR